MTPLSFTAMCSALIQPLLGSVGCIAYRNRRMAPVNESTFLLADTVTKVVHINFAYHPGSRNIYSLF